MTREEYLAGAERLLREFARVRNDNGPIHSHATVEAKNASSAISQYVDCNYQSAFFPPIAPGGESGAL